MQNETLNVTKAAKVQKRADYEKQSGAVEVFIQDYEAEFTPDEATLSRTLELATSLTVKNK